ncbi:hypothetical protein ETU10_11020, partial [Apibacter muscae]|uniref:hypothetical protein n=1 Tax=Apibacter muscae TaxID=2509004 RepID=UPI0011ACB3B1
MFKIKSIFYLIFIIPLNIKCQSKIDKNTNEVMGNNDSINSYTENILWKQLKQGFDYYYIESGVEGSDEYNKDDLQAAIYKIEQMLFNNNFNFIDKNLFNKKIKNIFGRTIDVSSNSEYLYVNFFNKCNKNIVYHPNDIDYQGIFIIKNKNFIMDFYLLPRIIDYQKEYPKLYEKEKRLTEISNREFGIAKVRYWKDMFSLNEKNKNVLTLVSRNKYLFNDDKSQFAWLINNDSFFMENLVTNFGYTEDKKLLN